MYQPASSSSMNPFKAASNSAAVSPATSASHSKPAPRNRVRTASCMDCLKKGEKSSTCEGSGGVCPSICGEEPLGNRERTPRTRWKCRTMGHGKIKKEIPDLSPSYGRRHGFEPEMSPHAILTIIFLAQTHPGHERIECEHGKNICVCVCVFVTIYVISCYIWFCPKIADLPAIYGYFNEEIMISDFEAHPMFRQTRPCGFHGYVPPSFLVSNCFFFGGYYKSSLFLSCFHPQRHSRSSSSPGTVVLSCRDGQSFHQSRGY